MIQSRIRSVPDSHHMMFSLETCAQEQLDIGTLCPPNETVSTNK